MKILIPFVAAALLVVPTWVTAEDQTQTLESVLLGAAAAGQTDFVKSLLDSGANIESKNNAGATPLIFAAIKGHKEVVKLLLDRGANVNAKTATGITPLIAAAAAGDVDVVKLLLEKGANVTAKDQQGRTALDMAEATGDTEVYTLLKSVGKASVSAPGPAHTKIIPQANPVGVVHTETIRQADSPGGLTVRAEPSPKGQVVAHLAVGSEVTYLGRASNGWVKLSEPIAGGWVAQSYLGERSLEASVISIDNPEQCLRVRNGPGVNHEKIGCLPKGARVKVTGTVQNNWAQIVEPMAGWVTARQILVPGLFPGKAATSGAQKELRAASEGTSYRRQRSERDPDSTKVDEDFDQEISQLRRDSEDAGSVQAGVSPPRGGLRIGPFRIGPRF